MKKNHVKTIIIALLVVLIVIIAAVTTAVLMHRESGNVDEKVYLSKLPKPELSGGARGELGIDKNINESTIDQYLNREDTVYRDLRMLEDPAKFEKIGGDRFLSGFIEGFEVIPLPYIIPVTGLPEAVGETYKGTTLFNFENGSYSPNFVESISIIEEYFPKDKNVFLMCGGGGYAGMMKNFLISMGWNEERIYNIGGYWYYDGNHKVTVREEIDGFVTYNFSKVKYHSFDFTTLSKATSYKDPNVKVKEIKLSTNKIEIEEGTSFQLNAYLLPNESENKDVKWESNDESIAKINKDGLVKGIKAGNTTIKVQVLNGIDDNISASCEVVVKAPETLDKVKLDDISSSIKVFKENDPDKVMKEFRSIVYDKNGELNEEYREYYDDGSYSYNNAEIELFNKYSNIAKPLEKARTDEINKLIDEKKSFIVLYYTETCEERPYSIFDNAPKILNKNNYQYLYLESGTPIFDSKLDTEKLTSGSILIVNEGKIYGYIDSNQVSIKDEQEFITWLSKYIDLK